MKKIKNSKGFTLMEMLIVVAIIAVLVAIAIPTFTTSLNKARVATDQANIRSGYASVMAEILTNQYDDATNGTTPTTYWLLNDGGVEAGATAPANAYVCKGDSSKIFTNGKTPEIAGRTVDNWDNNKNISYTYVPVGNTPQGGTASTAIDVQINVEPKQ